MDANNSLWVSELQGADYKKAWVHPELEDTLQTLCDWLQQMKKEGEDKKKEG